MIPLASAATATHTACGERLRVRRLGLPSARLLRLLATNTLVLAPATCSVDFIFSHPMPLSRVSACRRRRLGSDPFLALPDYLYLVVTDFFRCATFAPRVAISSRNPCAARRPLEKSAPSPRPAPRGASPSPPSPSPLREGRRRSSLVPTSHCRHVRPFSFASVCALAGRLTRAAAAAAVAAGRQQQQHGPGGSGSDKVQEIDVFFGK